MHVSEIGLPENQAPKLLEYYSNNTISIDKLKWSQIILNLKSMIINFPISHLEVVGFSHKSLDKVENLIYMCSINFSKDFSWI